ncbi:MAG: hypothetical protein H6631_16840 [Anaerolineaceae bacterium]|nr:hypothetical protein [Anaerolineaceae bacterium]
MQHWTVQDRYGHEIYLTEERWHHILEKHDELEGRLDDLLDTLRYGQRRQEALEPQKYRYRRAYDDLRYGFNHIIVVVVFRFDQTAQPNNFVITAWGAYILPKE